MRFRPDIVARALRERLLPTGVRGAVRCGCEPHHLRQERTSLGSRSRVLILRPPLIATTAEQDGTAQPRACQNAQGDAHSDISPDQEQGPEEQGSHQRSDQGDEAGDADHEDVRPSALGSPLDHELMMSPG